MQLLVVFGLALGACTVDTRTLADLGPVRLDLFIGSSMMQATIRYRPAEAPECAVMGPDFAANVSGLSAVTWPGGIADYCREPFADFYDWPLIEKAVLEIGDASRTIRCDLKDALVPRGLVRVDKDTWDVVGRDRVTVRWEPHHDINGLEFRVGLTTDDGSPWYVEWRMEGDLISFVVPPVESGVHTLWIAGSEEIDNANGCAGVPIRQLRAYHATASLNVK